MTTDDRSSNKSGDDRSDQAAVVRSRWHQWWTKAGPVKTVGFMTRPAASERVSDDEQELRDPTVQAPDAERRDQRQPGIAGGAQNCTFEVF